MLVKGLLSERHGLASSNRCSGKSSGNRLGLFLVFLVVSAQRHLALGGCLSVQEAALFDRTAGLDAGNRSAVGVARSAGAAAVGRRCQVRDVFGDGVLRANGTGVVALAGLGHGIVARVEVFAVFQVLGEVVGSRGKLAVEAEEPLLIRGERLQQEHRQRVSKCKSWSL